MLATALVNGMKVPLNELIEPGFAFEAILNYYRSGELVDSENYQWEKVERCPAQQQRSKIPDNLPDVPF